jgi:hypothetical protein
MKAEFLVDRTAVIFEVDLTGLVEPPRTLFITTRKCPKSPTLVYDLVFDRKDADRETLVYRMLGSRTPGVAAFQP